ncbi:MAG: hypothetical protein WAK50_06605 [Nitrososphaeraceae archaeon]
MVAASGKSVYVVWNDNTAVPSNELFFRASFPSLTSPEAIQNIIQTVMNLDNVKFRVETGLTSQHLALIFVSDRLTLFRVQ